MNNIYEASNQWAKRPPDERFATLEELHLATSKYREQSSTLTKTLSALRAVGVGDEIKIQAENIPQARMTTWGFKQLCSLVGAPPYYLQELPPELAVRNLNHGFERVKNGANDKDMSLFFHTVGNDILLKGGTTTKYSRIWNSAVVSQLLKLRELGWRVPPARPAFGDQPGARKATDADVLESGHFGLSVNVGDIIAPAGLYASCHDMFAFMINEKNQIDEGNGQYLSKGVMIHNSEVGAAFLKATVFLFRHVCGNHIVWDASQIKEVKIRHVGLADEKYFPEIQGALTHFSDLAASMFENRIKLAKNKELGRNKEEVIENTAKLNLLGKRKLAQAYELTEEHPEDGSPRTVWGMTQGITRMSQKLADYADDRTVLDMTASKILSLAA